MSLAPRTLTSLATGLLLVLSLAAVPIAPATSAATTLCSEWSGCVAAGYSDAGYAAVNKSSFWKMYGGHNCTNYVAYRMTQAGMPNTRPFSGTGNAWNWGVQLASKTDAVPAVGAVAWWNKGVSGAGSVGHVAYVEQVISPTEIVISEDSWSGTFHWRRLTVGSGWPSGFIHLVDKPVVNSAPVTVTGTPAVGQTIGSTPGAWTPGAALAYQWWMDGTPIAGATTPDLKLTSAMGGHSIVLRVTASLAGYTSTSADSPVTPVALGSLATSGGPAISGVGKKALVGATLTASQPTFSPAPRTVGVQWYADGTPIPGATSWTYQLTDATVLRSVTAVATAVRPGYAPTPATSTPVGPVMAGKVTIQKPFSVKGPAQVGKTLSVAPGVVAPGDATTTYSWLRDGTAIDGATGPTYVVTADDAGSQLAVRVAVGREGWLERRTVVTREARVAAKPTLTVKTAGKSRSALVWFRVEAPGVAKPSGRATVTVGGVSRTVTVSKGIGRVTVPGLAPGRQAVTVALAAGDQLVATSVQDKVRVRR